MVPDDRGPGCRDHVPELCTGCETTTGPHPERGAGRWSFGAWHDGPRRWRRVPPGHGDRSERDGTARRGAVGW